MSENSPIKTIQSQRYTRILIPIGLISIALLTVFWIILVWSIRQSVYFNKANLDWFDIRFYHVYTFIAAALLSLLLINPRARKSDLWTLVPLLSLGQEKSLRPQSYSPHKIVESSPIPPLSNRVWIEWQAIKWLFGFIVFIAFEGIPFIGKMMNPIMMMVFGLGNWMDVTRIFILPLFPASGSDLVNLMPTMEIQYRLIQIIAGAILTIYIIRMILRGLVRYTTGKYNRWMMDISGVGAAITFYILLGAPYWLMNVMTRYICSGLWILLIFLILTWVFFRGQTVKAEPLLTKQNFRRVMIIFGIIELVFLGTLTFLYLNWNNNYIAYEWNPQTDKRITVTRWAAGLNNINTGSLLALPTSNASTILGLVRQWDQTAAAVTMTKEIGAYNWMGLASSEIVFLNNTEYWVAPTAPNFPSANWISKHLIYTHAARIMVINTYSGKEVTPEKTYDIHSEPLLYYGQTPISGSGGFLNNVYVHIPGYDEVQNATYDGAPDYVLNGWQKSLWFIFAEGQFGFAFTSYPIEMLWNRDVYNRVQSILIPGLVIDPSAYLTSDGENVYYVMQIFTKYPIQSGFSASPYLRFFGVVLVNVYDGSMQGYTVHDLIKNDETDFITQFYDSYYSSWQKAPDWLLPELRYPEQLLGTPESMGQLDYDFIYHVSDPFVWRSGSQFYERPTGNVVQYIPWAIGEKTYFVGMQLAHFLSAQSKNLAGVYIAYGGDRLGQIDIFQNPSPSTTFIGPSAAENALTTNSEVRTQLTLLPNYRFGSYLLYSVGGQLEYFVAVYTNPGTAGVVTQLPFMTSISPTTGNVGVGSDAAQAYYNLINVQPSPTPGADKQQLLKDIASIVSSKKFTLVNATALSPTVWISEGDFNFNTLGLNKTEERITTFLDNYGSKSVDSVVYTWTTSGNINIGLLSFHSNIIELYYITIKFE